MEIKWHKVAWYSRALAAGIFIAMFLFGFFFGVRYEQKLTRPLERELEQKRDIVNWLDRALLIRAAEINRAKQ